MDSTFIATCQGIGLAIAAGALAGALGRTGSLGNLLAAIGAAVAAALFALSLSDSHHLAWPGVPAGIVIGLLAYLAISGVVAGAARRQPAASGGAISAMAALGALVVGGIALLLAPLALLALAGLAYLAVARRSRSRRKYAGLRVLR